MEPRGFNQMTEKERRALSDLCKCTAPCDAYGGCDVLDPPGKPKAPIVGANGNVFNLLGICNRALNRAGQKAQAEEMQNRVFACESYDKALSIMLEYVDPTDA